MTHTEMEAVVRAQLALDLGCRPEVLDGSDNAVMEWRELPGRRRYDTHPVLLDIAIWKGWLFAACAPALLPWAEEWLRPKAAEWLFLPKYLRQIDAALAPLGYEIGDATRFFLPKLPTQAAAPLFPVCWYEHDQLEPFRGDLRWDGPLAFNPLYPDMLVVAAQDSQGQPIAMAGASRDGDRLWQAGITVLPEYRGRGLGANLTALLRDELLRRDVVPFYGTAESHIVSQNVAAKAGFYPGFAYLHAKPKGT